MKSENFITTSDFATLANDGQDAPASITIIGSIAIGASAGVESHVDISVGSSLGSTLRSRIRSSKFNNRWMSTQQLVLQRSGSFGPYSIIAYAYPIAKGVIRCSVTINNPYNVSMTGESGSETFDFNISTFVPPFA